MKGYFIPDDHLRRMKGYDKLDNLNSYNPTIRSSVDFLTSTLFNFRRDTHFTIECSQNDWKKFFSNLFIDGKFNRNLYGQAHELTNFLEGVLNSAAVFGKAFYKIDYFQKLDNGSSRWIIENIRWLAVETMSPVFKKGILKGFVQQYSANCQEASLRKNIASFSPDEVFFVEWIFEETKKGVSPLLSLMPNDVIESKFLELMQLHFYALAHPEDHSRKAEKARYISFDKAKRVNEIAAMRSTAKIGGILRAPMTDYYDAYYLAKNRKKVAIIREFLVNQFNQQILSPLSAKNGLTESARIKLVGYLSSLEIEKLISDFKNSKISIKEIKDILHKDMFEKS